RVDLAIAPCADPRVQQLTSQAAKQQGSQRPVSPPLKRQIQQVVKRRDPLVSVEVGGLHQWGQPTSGAALIGAARFLGQRPFLDRIDNRLDRRGERPAESAAIWGRRSRAAKRVATRPGAAIVTETPAGRRLSRTERP